MRSESWIAWGALWTAAGVALGAFGAHALRERLELAGSLENWRTAVAYHVWHGLALVLVGMWSRERARGRGAAWALAVGSVLFSGSLYALCLGAPGAVFGPLTPLGGLSLIGGWLAFGIGALRAGQRGPK